MTPQDFNNSLIPVFSPRWFVMTESSENKEQESWQGTSWSFQNLRGPFPQM